MKGSTSPHCLTCGPTMMDPKALEIYAERNIQLDAPEDLMHLYTDTQKKVALITESTDNDIYFLPGSPSLGLYASFKSVLSPGDKVVVVCTGYYGEKIASILEDLQMDVTRLEFNHDSIIEGDPNRVRSTLQSVNPVMCVIVHCETGSCTVNNIEMIANLTTQMGILLCVDFISSFGAMHIRMATWHVDLGVFGPEKCLNLAPTLAIVTVSRKAWQKIDSVDYHGYDSLIMIRESLKKDRVPFSYDWRAMKTLNWKVNQIYEEGVETVYQKHKEIAQLTKKGLKDAGFTLYTSDEIMSDSCTAAYLPKDVSWSDLDTKLRAKNIYISNGKGQEADKVIRIGHMGIQADKSSLDALFSALREIIKL